MNIFAQNNITPSRSPHGERGLKSWSIVGEEVVEGRSPHGERGLKSLVRGGAAATAASLSSRRAWIEIENTDRDMYRELGRSPHGERGLKLMVYKESPLG